MLKSIRWTLQMWHAAILALALAGFGIALYFGISRARYHEVDAELEGAAQVLAAKVHVPPAWRHEPERPWPPRGPHRPPGEFLERDAALPANLLQGFGETDEDAPYFVIWREGGEILKASRPDLAVPDPGSPSGSAGHPPAPQIRQRADLREAIVYLPIGARVVVGASVRRERAELHRLIWLLVGVGTAVLGVGLAGGWMLSLRAIRPIRSIGEAAAAISGSNLSRRIDLAETHSELGTLAQVLNATFDRLEDAFEQQVRFTADASHELRTPLAVIHSHVELALSRGRSAEEYRQTLETCLKASRRMRGLIDSLLLLAKADAGKLDLERQPFDLTAVVDECVSLVGPLAAEKHVTLDTEFQEVEITGDPQRVGQVVMNLLTNAIRYNIDGGRVHVKAYAEGADAVVSVSDSGVGIAAQDQPHIFERFYRVDKARSRAAGGSGLGLAICKSIVEAHGGTLTLDSQVGEGATFVARFPCVPVGVSDQHVDESLPAPAPLA